jgi:hypothetical protein
MSLRGIFQQYGNSKDIVFSRNSHYRAFGGYCHYCASYSNPFCINRHYGHINELFLDLSVSKVGLKELWKLKWHEDFDTNGPWTIAGCVKPEDWPEWMRGFKDY